MPFFVENPFHNYGASERRLSYWIMQCYLPPDTRERATPFP